MALFHKYDVLTNTRGDSLPGYQVVVRDSTSGAVVPIYADLSGTPILSVSGIANTALTDPRGNYNIFVAEGTYDLEYRSPAGAVIDTTRQVPMQNGTMGDKGNPGAAGNVAFGRTMLKSRPVSEGDVWYLNEGGRSGNFRVRESGFTPPVTDLREAIYIQANNGFWFQRDLSGGWKLDWWEPSTLGDDGYLVLGQIDSLVGALAPGTEVQWGRNIVLYKGITTFTSSIAFVGVNPDVSRLDPATGANLSTGAAIEFTKSNSGVRRMGIKSMVKDGNSAQPQAIAFKPSSYAAARNFWVKECRVENTTAAVATYAYVLDADAAGPNAETTMNAPQDVTITDNVFVVSRYAGLFFGIDGNSVIERNIVRADPAATSVTLPTQQWNASFRILGAKGNLRICNNDLTQLEYNPAIANGPLRLAAMAYNNNLRRKSAANIVFQNNIIRGGTRAFSLEDFQVLTLGGNVWLNDVASTVSRIAFEALSDNLSIYKFGEVNGLDEAYVGITSILSGEGSGLEPAKRGQFRAGVKNIVSNKRTSDANPNNATFRMNFPVFSYMEVDRFNMLGVPLQAFDFSFESAAGLTLVVRDGVFPERTAGGFISTSTPINTGDPATSLQLLLTVGATDVTSTPNTYRRQPTGLYTRIYGS